MQTRRVPCRNTLKDNLQRDSYMKKSEIAEMYASFKTFYGFEKAGTDIERASCIKGAIGKTLRELAGDDGTTNLYAKGYDHVIIPHAVAGMDDETMTMLANEIVVLPEAAGNIAIVDADTGIYHFSNAEFSRFDVRRIGECHGVSYGAGIYLTDTPIPSYGKKYNVDISSLKKPYVLDIFDDNAVADYLYDCAG